MAESLVGSLITCFLVILALAMYYTIIGSSFQLHTIGLLYDADVVRATDDSSGSYRTESFKYNITAGHETTCSLTRPWYYMFYGSAKDAVDNTVLGTYREIWIASYNKHTCSDYTLKNYNLTIGITLFCVIGVIIFFVLFAIFYDEIKNYCRRTRNRIKGFNLFDVV